MLDAIRDLPTPLAVRSSAADEDGADASFAGQHLTLLNIQSADDVPQALREIWWSANSDSAITYRKRVGLFTRPSVGVVVQSLLDPDAAGVMFTRNPVTGAEERVIEATWGLGEAVVQGLVIPDSFQLDRDGNVMVASPGRKQIAVRKLPDGGTVEEDVPADRVEALCLSDDELQQLGTLATKAEEIYGPGRDIEWAVCNGTLYLLQCRAVTAGATSGGGTKKAPPAPAPVEKVEKVPFFAGLERDELEQIAALFKERRFVAGETVVVEGSAGAAFFIIDSGDAVVTIHGVECGTLSDGDHFGEIALIDEGPRGDRHRDDRPRVPRPHVLGVPAARRAQRRDRLEAAAVDGEDAPRGRAEARTVLAIAILVHEHRVESVQRFRPALLVQVLARGCGEEPLFDDHLRRIVLLQRERDERLPIVGVGILIPKRVHQAVGRVDLTKLPGENERIAFGWLHLDPVATSDAHVEVDARSGEPFGTPPRRQQVRLDLHPEHQWPRRGQDTLHAQEQAVGACSHTPPFSPRRVGSCRCLWQTVQRVGYEVSMAARVCSNEGV